MDVREIGYEGVDWMHLAQNRDGNEPSIKGGEFLDQPVDFELRNMDSAQWS
jgi:hypothetical protein